MEVQPRVVPTDTIVNTAVMSVDPTLTVSAHPVRRVDLITVREPIDIIVIPVLIDMVILLLALAPPVIFVQVVGLV